MSKKRPTGKATKTAGPKKAAKKSKKPPASTKGINDIDFSDLHVTLDYYEELLNGVVGRTGSTRAADIRDKIRSLQADIICESTMIVGF